MIADESNNAGSNKAANHSKIKFSSEATVSALEILFIDSGSDLPSFVEKFSYDRVKSLHALYMMASDKVISSAIFDDVTTGNVLMSMLN